MRMRRAFVFPWLLMAISLLPRGRARGGAASTCTDPLVSSLPFCNVSLTFEQRVTDLISRMSLEEKLSQIVSNASALPRLDIPAYEWWEEALHGVAESPGVEFADPVPAATSFPQVILSACSFNVSLWNQIAQATSIEAMAMYNAGRAGLTYWSPNINIYRDPRWGRGQETPGEDPYLSGKYAEYFVRGLQEGYYDEEDANISQHTPSNLKVSSCCKHFTAYDMEKSDGTDTFHFNAEVTVQDLEDTFEPPFKNCIVHGRASGLMCSYNRVNGIPTCANPDYLIETIRKQWGFQGYIVSDCDAVALLYEYYNYTSTAEDAAADVLLAGLDLNCGTFLRRHTAAAIQQGKVTEADVDRALANVMTLRMRLGLFDANTDDPYDSIGTDAICTKEHMQLALEAAEQSIVLLKNSGSLLPFKKNSFNTIAVIGPNGNATTTMLGNYAGIPCQYTTVFQGVQDYVANVIFEPGCSDVACNSTGLFSKALTAAANSEAVFLVVGLDTDQEREGLDRTTLLLPGFQQELVTKVTKTAKGPVVLVIMSGGPVDVSFAEDIQGILWVGYPGEAGGRALAKVLFGDVNPAGRLTMTWYPEEFTRTRMTDMRMRPNSSDGFPGRTYRFYTGKKVFEFGDGLSYTNFTTEICSPPPTFTIRTFARHLTTERILTDHTRWEYPVEKTPCESLNFKVYANITNVGERDGDYVSLLFTSPPVSTRPTLLPPQKQLKSFRRVNVKAGGYVTVEFDLNVCKDLSLVNEAGKQVLVDGNHKLTLGDSQQTVTLNLR